MCQRRTYRPCCVYNYYDCPTLWELPALGVQMKEHADVTLDRDVQLVAEFAEHFSLCWSIETAGIAPVIKGTHGAFIYVYDESNGGVLGLAFVPDLLPGDGWN